MTISITIDGMSLKVKAGENLAAVMSREGFTSFRKHPVDKSIRAPFCMMGVCYECLLEVNGVRSTQACLISVEDGMKIRRHLND